MSGSDDAALARATVREAARAFHSHEALERAIDDLTGAGFDRSTVMARREAVEEKLGGTYAPAAPRDGAPAIRALGDPEAAVVEAELAGGGVILWIRARAPEREEISLRILRKHGAEDARALDVEIEKRVQDIPFATLLSDERTT